MAAGVGGAGEAVVTPDEASHRERLKHFVSQPAASKPFIGAANAF